LDKTEHTREQKAVGVGGAIFIFCIAFFFATGDDGWGGIAGGLGIAFALMTYARGSQH
jgi:hypothetical protein